ncbi:MAG: orotidine-5'-phosphate decarboxylase [Paracoccus sp.]|nr:MAG: orotidine-5'-phosphate decarboxylase [Paracoccus sp. (in: a-proteobacteria)]
MFGNDALIFLAHRDGLGGLQEATRPFRELFHVHRHVLLFTSPRVAGALLRHAPVRVFGYDLGCFTVLSSAFCLCHNAAISWRTGAGMDDRLIVALDVPNALEGLALAEKLGDAVGFYKIGLGMLTGGGLALANELKQEHGKRIFLDMKLFDIGATVEAAVRGLAQFDLDFLTVHGDPHVVHAAKQGAAGTGLKILGVTILTSLERADLDAGMIQPGDIHQITVERASRAFDAGADGIICSPREAQAIRALPGAGLIVTPGVRPAGADLGDQKRVETPASAIAAGADHIVVGRPVWQAADPKAAARAILTEMGPVTAHRLAK